jgi:hypothetical protein
MSRKLEKTRVFTIENQFCSHEWVHLKNVIVTNQLHEYWSNSSCEPGIIPDEKWKSEYDKNLDIVTFGREHRQ